MAVDDRSQKRAARVCAGRDQGECRPSIPAQWCTRQDEVGLREGEWSRANRERDRRRADEEAKHDGDRSRVCDVRELVRASHLGRSQKLPRWHAKILDALGKKWSSFQLAMQLICRSRGSSRQSVHSALRTPPVRELQRAAEHKHKAARANGSRMRQEASDHARGIIQVQLCQVVE